MKATRDCYNAGRKQSTCHLIKRLTAVGVIGHVANCFQFRNLFQERFFHAIFKGYINGAATLTTPTKPQYRNILLDQIHQTHLASMRSQHRVNFSP